VPTVPADWSRDEFLSRTISTISYLSSYLRKCLIGVSLTIGFTMQTYAAIMITAVQSGPDVVFSSPGGTLDLSGLTINSVQGSTLGTASIQPDFPYFIVGGSQSIYPYSVYAGATLPSPFGTGGYVEATSSSGYAGPGIFSQLGVLIPTGYISGATFDPFWSVYAGQTFAGLGMTPGTYATTWSTDSIVLNVQTVPIPSAIWLFLSALGIVGWVRRRPT